MSPDNPSGCKTYTFEKSPLLPSPLQIAILHDILRSTTLPTGMLASGFHSVIAQSPLELERYTTEIQKLEETPEGAPPSCRKGPLRYPKPLSKGYLRGPLPPDAAAESFLSGYKFLIITDGCPALVGCMHRADAADAHRDFNFHSTINSDLVPENSIQLSMVQICLSMGQVRVQSCTQVWMAAALSRIMTGKAHMVGGVGWAGNRIAAGTVVGPPWWDWGALERDADTSSVVAAESSTSLQAQYQGGLSLLGLILAHSHTCQRGSPLQAPVGRSDGGHRQHDPPKWWQPPPRWLLPPPRWWRQPPPRWW
ncbi:hypothetical protein B0H19DRAFT_1055711 [Mycena capillaripes]|nr:hypothetical protein B0H19DRAFT_1055711 [Mycena capillaripes]